MDEQEPQTFCGNTVMESEYLTGTKPPQVWGRALCLVPEIEAIVFGNKVLIMLAK